MKYQWCYWYQAVLGQIGKRCDNCFMEAASIFPMGWFENQSIFYEFITNSLQRESKASLLVR